MREDQGDGLRMFVVNKLRELLRIGFLQGIEAGRFRSQRLHQPVHHFPGMFRPECGDEHFLGEVHSALQDEIARHRHLVELVQHGLGQFVGDAGDAGNFVPDLLHLFLVQLTQDFGAGLIPQDDHEDGGFAYARNLLNCFYVLNHGINASARSSRILGRAPWTWNLFWLARRYVWLAPLLSWLRAEVSTHSAPPFPVFAASRPARRADSRSAYSDSRPARPPVAGPSRPIPRDGVAGAGTQLPATSVRRLPRLPLPQSRICS